MGGQSKGEQSESHTEIEERLKMKHRDLRLRFAGVMNKKKSINELKKKYDYFDRKHTEIEAEYKGAIEYQREELFDKQDKNQDAESRQEKKKRDMDNLTREKNDYIDQNFKSKSELNDLKKKIE